jgi:hypothetical protein
MAEKEYQRLTWSRMKRTGLLTAVATRSSLWLGKDHLLCIDSTGYAEEYKRFYFRDIQAVTLMRTRRRLWINLILGPIAAIFLAITILTAPSSSPSQWNAAEILGGSVLAGIAAFLGLLVLLNTLKGPGCVCHLRTAVQTEMLPSLNRLRRAHKVLNRIRPLIEAVQGARLSPEEIAGTLANSPASNAPPVIGGYGTARGNAPLRHYAGTAHLILFWLLLADVPLTSVSVIYESPWMDGLSVLLMLVTLAFAITSLLKQRDTTLTVGLKRLPWIVVGWAALMLMTAIAYGIVMAINNPGALDREIRVLEDPVVLVMTVISTSVNAIMGFAGLVLLRKFRASTSAPASGPPAFGGPSTA